MIRYQLKLGGILIKHGGQTFISREVRGIRRGQQTSRIPVYMPSPKPKQSDRERNLTFRRPGRICGVYGNDDVGLQQRYDAFKLVP